MRLKDFVVECAKCGGKPDSVVASSSCTYANGERVDYAPVLNVFCHDQLERMAFPSAPGHITAFADVSPLRDEFERLNPGRKGIDDRPLTDEEREQCRRENAEVACD